MDLRQLRYFTAIADYGSFSEAAARLRIAQSALSRHTSTLEQELGVRLFHRHPRGVDLTHSGTLLLAREIENPVTHPKSQTGTSLEASESL